MPSNYNNRGGGPKKQDGKIADKVRYPLTMALLGLLCDLDRNSHVGSRGRSVAVHGRRNRRPDLYDGRRLHEGGRIASMGWGRADR